jgi:ADP-ribose pyrophosphatase YjhB (NUDIX family)
MSWSLPGGKLKDDEDSKACARRQLIDLLNFEVRHRQLDLIHVLRRYPQEGVSVSTALFQLSIPAQKIPRRFDSPYRHMLGIEWVPAELLPSKDSFVSHHRALLEKAHLWPKRVAHAV